MDSFSDLFIIAEAGVNHNGEVNRPVPVADALGLWELGVPIRVERSVA